MYFNSYLKRSVRQGPNGPILSMRSRMKKFDPNNCENDFCELSKAGTLTRNSEELGHCCLIHADFHQVFQAGRFFAGPAITDAVLVCSPQPLTS